MIKSHATQWLHTISSFPPHLVYTSFLKFIIWKIGNTKSGSLKMKQKKTITKLLLSVTSLLQSASGITTCDILLLQSTSGITKYDRLLLQRAPDITKCDSYDKVRSNKVHISL